MGNPDALPSIPFYCRSIGVAPVDTPEDKPQPQRVVKPSVLSASSLVQTVEHYHDSLSPTKFEIVKSAFQLSSWLTLSGIGAKAFIIVGLAAIGITSIPGAVIVSAAVVLGLVVFCVYTKYQLYQREKALKEVDRFLEQFKWLDLTAATEAEQLKEKIRELEDTVKKYRSWFGDDRSSEERGLLKKRIDAVQAQLKTIAPDVMKAWCEEASTRMSSKEKTIDSRARTMTWEMPSGSESVTWTTREVTQSIYWINTLLQAQQKVDFA